MFHGKQDPTSYWDIRKIVAVDIAPMLSSQGGRLAKVGDSLGILCTESNTHAAL